MKKLFLMVVFALLVITPNSYAIEVQLEPYITIPSDSEMIVQKGKGIQLSVQHKKIYGYISTDTNPVRFSGQTGIDVNLDSLGMGFIHKFNDS